MLADVGGRDNNLSFADIIILNEDDFEKIADILISVYNFTNCSDKTDDGFCLGCVSLKSFSSGVRDQYHPVTRSSFASKNRCSWYLFFEFFGFHLLKSQISVNDTKDVHLLTFILVYSLDLDIEQRMRVDCDLGRIFDILGQPDLCGQLDFHPLMLCQWCLILFSDVCMKTYFLPELLIVHT